MYWSKKASQLIPYKAGEQPKEQMLKLNTNENAYDVPQGIIEAITREASNLRLYPKPNADGLVKAIAGHHNLKENQVFCANGSDEALAMSFLAFFDDEVTTYDITYSFYPVWAQLFNVKIKETPLKEDFFPRTEFMKEQRNIIIANPNAPTGIALGIEEVEEVVAHTKGVCIIDEAYIDFGGVSAIGLINKYNNLLVVRTMSKFNSLAGLRVGYCLGNENLIKALYTVKDSFNSYPLDMLAQIGGIYAIKNHRIFEENAKKIIATREYTTKELEKIGVHVLPSSTNFIFAKFEDAIHVFDELKKERILVRHFDKDRIKEFLRITIGTQEQMEHFIREIKKICK